MRACVLLAALMMAAVTSFAAQDACKGFRYESPEALESLIKRIYAESEGKPDWSKKHGIPPKEWAALSLRRKFDRLYGMISEEFCRLGRTHARYERVLSTRAFDTSEQICAMTDSSFQARRRDLTAVTGFAKAARKKFPYGYELARRQGSSEGRIIARLPGVQRRARGKLNSLIRMRRLCEFEAEEFNGAGRSGRRALARLMDRLGAELDPATVDPGSPPRPKESLAGLTAGIVMAGYSPAPGLPQNPKWAGKVFRQALRHLHSIPEGRRILRDVQQVRTWLGESNREESGVWRDKVAKLKGDIRRTEERWTSASEEEASRLFGEWMNLRSQLSRQERILQAALSAPSPVIEVSIGHSDADQWEGIVAVEATSDARFVMRILLDSKWLKGGNPSRSVSAALAKDLRRAADGALLHLAMARKLGWKLFEDRASLAEARAVLQQRAAQTSGRLDSTSPSFARDMLRDPTAFRLRMLCRPRALWSAAVEDLVDPDRGLRERLSIVLGYITNTSGVEREEILRRIDPQRDLIGAYYQAVEEAHQAGAARWTIPERFFELAERTGTAGAWLEQLARLSSSLSDGRWAPWKEEFALQEEEFWLNLAGFTRRHAAPAKASKPTTKKP